MIFLNGVPLFQTGAGSHPTSQPTKFLSFLFINRFLKDQAETFNTYLLDLHDLLDLIGFLDLLDILVLLDLRDLLDILELLGLSDSLVLFFLLDLNDLTSLALLNLLCLQGSTYKISVALVSAYTI